MGQWPFTVERPPEAIDHAAKPSLARVKGWGIGEQHARAGRQALGATFRHDGDPSIGERDHFAGELGPWTLHQHPVADGDPAAEASYRHRRAVDGFQASPPLDAREPTDQTNCFGEADRSGSGSQHCGAFLAK